MHQQSSRYGHKLRPRATCRTTLWLVVLIIHSLVSGMGAATKTGARARLMGFAGVTIQAALAKLMRVAILSSRTRDTRRGVSARVCQIWDGHSGGDTFDPVCKRRYRRSWDCPG